MRCANLPVLAIVAAGIATAPSLGWGATAEGSPAKHDQPASLSVEETATNAAPGRPWTLLKVAPGDSLSALFERAGLPASDWVSLLRLKGKVNALRHLHPGDILRIQKTPDEHLAALEYRLSPLQTLLIERSGQQFTYSVVPGPTTVRVVRVAGRIRHSLLSAARRAGVGTKVAAHLADIFHWRIDLSRSIQAGDQFVLIYRRLYAGHRFTGSGPILAAKLKTHKRTVTAFRYTDKQGHSAYYDQKGQSLKPSILRTPLHYTRVSSPFSLHRYNPVLHIWRPHYGVDLAAPKGTPIEAAADGRVKFIGRDGGYGRLVILKNFGPYSTRYAHMLRFADGLHKGDSVRQGQIIGYVGESGEATGPHLHFEIRVHGVPKPPLKVKLPDGAPIPGTEVASYRHAIAPLLAELKTAPTAGRTLLAERQVPEQGGSDGDGCLNITTFQPTIAFALPNAPSAGSAQDGHCQRER